MTVSRVTIHHQGAGVPSDATGYGSEGYTYGIGRSRWYRFRSVEQSFATKGHNGDSVDICLSGNRDLAPVTDFDLTLISEVCADARFRHDLGGTYTTYPHGIGHVGAVTNGAVWTLPAGYPLGNRPTECPGVHTIERWPEVVAATRPHVVPPTGDDDLPLNDADKAYIRDTVLSIVRGEGISGAADAAHSNVDDAVIAALGPKLDAILAALKP